MIFKEDITPTWENEQNANGGRIFIKLENKEESN